MNYQSRIVNGELQRSNMAFGELCRSLLEECRHSDSIRLPRTHCHHRSDGDIKSLLPPSSALGRFANPPCSSFLPQRSFIFIDIPGSFVQFLPRFGVRQLSAAFSRRELASRPPVSQTLNAASKLAEGKRQPATAGCTPKRACRPFTAAALCFHIHSRFVRSIL
jgi:hypothetical protein